MQWCSVGAHAWFALKTVRAVAQTAAGKKVVPRIIRPLQKQGAFFYAKTGRRLLDNEQRISKDL